MAVQRRQDGEGVPRTAARRRPGPANTQDEDAEPQSSRTAPHVRSRGTGSRQARPDSLRSPVRSTPVEPEEESELTSELEEDADTWTDNQDTEWAEEWAPDALDDQIQEELAEEFEAQARRASSRTTRRARTAEPSESSGTGSMPSSGVVPPVADDGMHTMDGQAAIPLGHAGFAGEDTEDELPPAAARYRRNMDPSQIYRGRSRLALIRDLAMGEWTDASIAQSIGVPYDVIVDFRLTYETEINEVRLSLANQLAIESAGMWISKRQNRIAEMQEDYEDIDLVLAVMRENTKVHLKAGMDGSDSQIKGDVFDTNMLLGSRRHQNLLRSKLAIMKAVSDELSPRNKDEKAEDGTNQIRYVIEQDGPGDDIISSLT